MLVFLKKSCRQSSYNGNEIWAVDKISIFPKKKLIIKKQYVFINQSEHP